MNLYHVTKFSPYSSLTVYCFYTKISEFMLVLSTRIVLDCFYLLILYSEKFSTDVCRLSYAVNVNLNLSFNVKLTGLRSSYGKISSPLTEISGTEPACPLIWTRRNFFTKDLEARRDLEHQASSVNRAHMKRPILSFSNSKDDYVDVLYIDPAKEKLTFYGTKNSKSTENRQTSIW